MHTIDKNTHARARTHIPIQRIYSLHRQAASPNLSVSHNARPSLVFSLQKITFTLDYYSSRRSDFSSPSSSSPSLPSPPSLTISHHNRHLIALLSFHVEMILCSFGLRRVKGAEREGKRTQEGRKKGARESGVEGIEIS